VILFRAFNKSGVTFSLKKKATVVVESESDNTSVVSPMGTTEGVSLSPLPLPGFRAERGLYFYFISSCKSGGRHGGAFAMPKRLL
jgi:hypothetical protein